MDGAYRFRIAPATLAFRDVFDLKIDLDWTGYAVTPFSISSIGREKLPHEGWAWTIGVNYPEGVISFQSTGFMQVLRGPLVTTSEQFLESSARGAGAPQT